MNYAGLRETDLINNLLMNKLNLIKHESVNYRNSCESLHNDRTIH